MKDFPMMTKLSTSLVLSVNIGAGRPNVSGFECLCLLCCPVMFSLSLSFSCVQLVLHQFLESSLDSQSSPSYSPVPWVAQVDSMCHCGDNRLCQTKKREYKCSSVHADLIFTAGVERMFLFRLLTVLLRRACRPSLSVSSLTDKALGRSCLLANTSKTASFNSSSSNQKVKKQRLEHQHRNVMGTKYITYCTFKAR